MFYQIVSIVAPMFLIAAVGYFYGSKVRPEMAITNQMNMDIFIPALIFHVMVQKDFYPAQYLSLTVGGALIVIISGLLAYLLAKGLKYEWRTVVPPSMFTNWGNLGLPLYVLSLGQEALNGGVMLFITGNILCFTIGVYIYSGKMSLLDALKMPVMLAVIVGGLINTLGIVLPKFIGLPIEMMGQVAIPLMLFSLGVRLTKTTLVDIRMSLVVAVFCPVVGVGLAFILVQFLNLNELQSNTLILFGVLPPAVMNFMLADRFGDNPEKVASIVLIGNLVSLVSIPVLLYFVLG